MLPSLGLAGNGADGERNGCWSHAGVFGRSTHLFFKAGATLRKCSNEKAGRNAGLFCLRKRSDSLPYKRSVGRARALLLLPLKRNCENRLTFPWRESLGSEPLQIISGSIAHCSSA